MVTITVTVIGGVAPQPIMVKMQNLTTNAYVLDFERPGSFSETFPIGAGGYTIFVGGVNPENGSTTITISGAFVQGPLPLPTQSCTNIDYEEIFYVEI